MDNRLFVGNLSFQTNADAVREVFAEFGAVEDVHLVTDRETGRSRGFAFVTMGTADEAQKAITEMNGQQLDGRPLRVNLAEERPRRSGPPGGGGGGGGWGGGGGGRGFGGDRGGDRGGFGGGGGGFGDDRGGGRGGRGGRDRGGRGGDRGGRW